MVKIIKEFPRDVVGIEATGTISREDYENVIIPEVKVRIREFKRIKFFCHLGEGSKLTPGAMWDDMKIGIAHYSAWKKCAIVTDIRWIGDVIRLLSFMMPCEVRVFGNEKLEEAKHWIVTDA